MPPGPGRSGITSLRWLGTLRDLDGWHEGLRPSRNNNYRFVPQTSRLTSTPFEASGQVTGILFRLHWRYGIPTNSRLFLRGDGLPPARRRPRRGAAFGRDRD